MERTKRRFGWGHDKCNFCHKIDNPLVDANVTQLVKYRSTIRVDYAPDRFRVVMDFSYIDNVQLYNTLKNKRNKTN